MHRSIPGANSHVLEPLVELGEPHVGAQLLEEDLDENTAGGRRRLLAHFNALENLQGITHQFQEIWNYNNDNNNNNVFTFFKAKRLGNKIMLLNAAAFWEQVKSRLVG